MLEESQKPEPRRENKKQELINLFALVAKELCTLSSADFSEHVKIIILALNVVPPLCKAVQVIKNLFKRQSKAMLERKPRPRPAKKPSMPKRRPPRREGKRLKRGL